MYMLIGFFKGVGGLQLYVSSCKLSGNAGHFALKLLRPMHERSKCFGFKFFRVLQTVYHG